MRKAAIVVLLAALISLDAVAGDLTGSAELSYQDYEYGNGASSGFRQTYDLQLRKALNATTDLRVFVRAEDFASDSGSLGFASVDTQQLQPGLDLTINSDKITLAAHTELQRTETSSGHGDLTRSIERTNGTLEWRPDRLPVFNLFTHRYVTQDDIVDTNLTDESSGVRAWYPWHGFWVAGDERRSRSADLNEGYDRQQTMTGAELGYSKHAFGDLFAIDLLASARSMETDEKGLRDTTSSILTPVTIVHASNGFDETPGEDRDAPLTPNPVLVDGNLTTSAGISIGPDSQSFQNVALEMGRLEPVDEIRVVVRDERGDPIQLGGGPVQWDVWTSEDGQLWTQLPGAITTFNGALSLYSVQFDQVLKRWFKVVSFGVNVRATLVTEAQAFYHTDIAAGGERHGTQDDRLATVGLVAKPLRGLMLSYSGSYFASDQEFSGVPYRSSTGLDHQANAQYDFRAPFALRASYTGRTSEELDGIEERTKTVSGFLDWIPTNRLRLSGEVTRQIQTLDGAPYNLETQAFHADTWIFPTLSVIFAAGEQSETPDEGEGEAVRNFVDVTSSAQLTRALRLLVTGSLQRVEESDGYESKFLGAGRDNRVNADVIWRPGAQLAVTASLGWFSGESRDGTTGRFRVEWYPFGDGSLVVGGWVDEDVDSVSDREATRAQFITRWNINPYARFEVTYTAVATTLESNTNQQSTLFATLSLTN